MKKIIILVMAFLLVSVASSFQIIQIKVAGFQVDGISQSDPGKNYIFVNSTETISAKEFLLKNPSVTMISYNDGNRTIGYVDILGGIGKNFLIENGKTYEIYLNKESQASSGGPNE